jgi:hypothetical protein
LNPANWLLWDGCTVDADAAVAPDGNTTAERINFGAAASSLIYRSDVLYLNDDISMSIFARTESGTKNIRLMATPGYTTGDLLANTSWQRLTKSGNLTNNTEVWVSNGSGGGAGSVLAWGFQIERAPFPSSPILTGAGAVTRPPDVGYFPSASVPAAFKSTGSKVKLINEWDETEPPGDVYVWAIDADNYMKWDNTAKTYVIYIGGVKKMESNALTLDRNTQHEVTANLLTGDTTVAGATTGDGTNAGTACTVPAGNLYWGCDHASANQYFGKISEPDPL